MELRAIVCDRRAKRMESLWLTPRTSEPRCQAEKPKRKSEIVSRSASRSKIVATVSDQAWNAASPLVSPQGRMRPAIGHEGQRKPMLHSLSLGGSTIAHRLQDSEYSASCDNAALEEDGVVAHLSDADDGRRGRGPEARHDIASIVTTPLLKERG